jgi:glycosyltransferase involved in cell wall biosynthesis
MMTATEPSNERPLPRISLVTCSYQQARYLETTIQSVLSQNYPALEYSIIDGESTDGSVDVIRRYESQLADWVSEPDRGQTDALIKGFERTDGEIMGWLCSDDLLLPGALQAVGEFFLRNPSAMAVYGDALWIDGEGRYLRPKREIPFSRFVFLHDHNYIPQPSMFWRRSLYRDVGGLDRAFNLAMDGDLWDRFAEHGSIAHLPRYLSCMRCYPEQKTRSLRPQAKAENAALRLRRTGAASEYFRPVLFPCAKALRVAIKTFSGVYAAEVPAEHLQWLERNCLDSDARLETIVAAPP